MTVLQLSKLPARYLSRNLFVGGTTASWAKDDFHRGSHRIKSQQTRSAHPSTVETVDAGTLKPLSQMPGPKGLPFIGTLWDYVKKDGLSFSKMFEIMTMRSEKYGPVYKERIGHLNSVIVTDLEEYNKVMQVDGRYPVRATLEPMVHYRNKRGLPLGTVNSQGEEWHRHRVVLAKKMLRPKEVLEYLPSMDAVGDDFVKRCRRRLTPDRFIPNLEEEMLRWAMESICTVLLEERLGCLDDPPPPHAIQFLENLMEFFSLMQPLMYSTPIYKIYPTKLWRRYEKHTDNVTAHARHYVDKKMATLRRQAEMGISAGEKEEKSAFLTYLLKQKSLTPAEANAHVMDMMMGSIETTANGSMWAMYCLSRNPAAQETLYKEINRALPQKGPITAEILNSKLSYVKACLKETFRLYPITFATSRFIPQDIELGGYHVPKGTHVQANLHGIGRSTRYFENPEKFQPDRWLRSNEDVHMYNALSSLPFGHGPRMCIGRRFAEQEIYLILTKIVQNFRLESGGEEVQPVLKTVMTSDKPMKIRFIPRH